MDGIMLERGPLEDKPVVSYTGCSRKEEGLIETNSLVDILGEIDVSANYDWENFTSKINEIFMKQVSSSLLPSGQIRTELSVNSISYYEVGEFSWSSSTLPDSHISPFTALAGTDEDLFVCVHLKDYLCGCTDSLSYSSLVPNHLLQEYIRIVGTHKNVMFISEDELEGRHFAYCFANWLKLVEENNRNSCIVGYVEKHAINSIPELIQCLTDHGILQTSSEILEHHKFILLVDLDFIIRENLSPGLFEWLGLRGQDNKFYLANGLSATQKAVFLQEKLLVLGYGTQPSFSKLDQWIYRLFRVIELPFTMPYLLRKWLRQKSILYTRNRYNLTDSNRCCRYVSDMYTRIRKDLSKMEIIQSLPDVSLFLSSPVENPVDMSRWIKSLWKDHICPLVEDVIFQQVVGANKSQQELLRKVTLQTIYETAILPGCPVTL